MLGVLSYVEVEVVTRGAGGRGLLLGQARVLGLNALPQG